MSIKTRAGASMWMTLPYIVWMCIFLLGPLFLVAMTSFQTKGIWGGIHYDWSGSAFQRLFDVVYFRVFLASLKLATLTAFSCLIIGYPMAWSMSRMQPQNRRLAMLLVMLPFMSNFVVRAYAVKFLIGVEGPINHFLMNWGWIEGPLFLQSLRLAIWFGLVTNYLPFMVLPLYVALERYDVAMIEAAQDLGASWSQVWWQVLWPMTKKPVMAGLILVFVPAMGEFVIPDLMGGGKTMYLGNLMTEQFLRVRDWPFGAAVCLLMMTAIGGFAAYIARVSRT